MIRFSVGLPSLSPFVSPLHQLPVFTFSERECRPGKWAKAVSDPHPTPRWPFLSQGSGVSQGFQLSVERLDLVTKVTASITRIASAGGDCCIKLDSGFVAWVRVGEGVWFGGSEGVTTGHLPLCLTQFQHINDRT